MSTIIVQPNYMFGLRTEVTNNLCFIDEHTVVFPCGNNCVLHNIQQRRLTFIPGTEKSKGMQAWAISANRSYLAVSEPGEKATITIYDLQHEQGRKRKLLTGTTAMQEFICMDFSPDSKYLISQSAGPDCKLVFWLWEKNKVMASVQSSSSSQPVTQISFNPSDNTQVCVSGPSLFKLFRYSEGSLEQSSILEETPVSLLCHAWVSAERVVVGTDMGLLLVFDSGELRWEMDVGTEALQATDEAVLRHTDKRKLAEDQEERGGVAGLRVTSILPYSTGFICSVGFGAAYLFERTEAGSYRRTRVIRIPSDPNSGESSSAERQEVATMCMSPLQETLAISTDRGQLYHASLASEGEPAHFEFLSCSLHSKSITDLSTCIRKPLIATSSLDHSVRIWNFQTNVLELYKDFQEEVYSVSLHPSGLYILVAFYNQVALMKLFIDDIRPSRTFLVPRCQECVFSHGGHLFAAISGNVIHMYSVTTSENVLSLRGHFAKVRAVAWSQDDRHLVSCGMDGGVYVWNTHSGKCESEIVLKSCNYNGVALSADSNTVFAVGTDGTLKEMQDCQVLKEVPSDGVVYTAVAVSRSGRAVFVGTSSGTVRLFNYPLPVHQEWVEHQAHCGPVTKMVITCDEQRLVTVSEDGSLLLWEITDHMTDLQKRRSVDFEYSDEILISTYDQEDKKKKMAELQIRLKELEAEGSYSLQLRQLVCEKQTNELSKVLQQNVVSFTAENKVLMTEMEKQNLSHHAAFIKLKETHIGDLRDSERSYIEKRMQQVESYEELQGKYHAMEQNYVRQLDEVEQRGHQALEKRVPFYQAKLQEADRLLGQCQARARQQQLEYDETVKREEEVIDQKNFGQYKTYKEQLLAARQAEEGLKEDLGLMKHKLDHMKSVKGDKQSNITDLQDELQMLEARIRSQDEESQDLQRTLSESKRTLHDREKCLEEQRKKKQDLQKLKSLKESKCIQLEKQIDSFQDDKLKLKEVIQKLESEIELQRKKGSQNVLTTSSLELKLKAKEEEVHKEMQKVEFTKARISHFKADLEMCVGLISEPMKLKSSVLELCSRYLTQEDVLNLEASKKDMEIQEDHSRQLTDLKRRIAFVKRDISEESEIHQRDHFKAVEEQMALMEENDHLREELRILERQAAKKH